MDFYLSGRTGLKAFHIFEQRRGFFWCWSSVPLATEGRNLHRREQRWRKSHVAHTMEKMSSSVCILYCRSVQNGANRGNWISQLHSPILTLGTFSLINRVQHWYNRFLLIFLCGVYSIYKESGFSNPTWHQAVLSAVPRFTGVVTDIARPLAMLLTRGQTKMKKS